MIKYKVVYSDNAVEQLDRLDRSVRERILKWIDKNLVDCEDPRAHGKGLTSNRSGQWRYRVGDYRIIADIRDNEVVILVLEVGHKSKVYR